MKRISIIMAAAAFVFGAHPASADWLQWRGPGGLGVTTEKAPITWSAKDNIAWKHAMPGAGGSCPIIMGDRVFITCYSGYGVEKNAGDQKSLKRHLICVDRKSGKPMWTRDFPAPLPEPQYSGYQALHGYASNTPISDGKLIWIFLGRDGVYCYDLEGNQKWHKSVGNGTHGWGSGTSLVLHNDKVIVNASVESGSLIAFNKNTGEQVWASKTMRSSWNTPVLVKLANGSTELAVATNPIMYGFDPDTGNELWRATTYNWYVCPSLVANDGVVYGLQHSICVAVKAGGKGDVTDSNVLWKKNFGHVVSSPIYYKGHVYFCSQGTAYCVDAADGTALYKERLKGANGDFYASPIVADGKIYYVSRNHGAFVVEAGAKFKQLANNTLTPDTSVFNATPSVSGSQLFLRSDRFLYCIGK